MRAKDARAAAVIDVSVFHRDVMGADLVAPAEDLSDEERDEEEQEAEDPIAP